jgi:hypothetical protein
MRRRVLELAEPFEERRPFHGCEDYDLWLRLAKQGAKFYGMKEKLVRYRRHSSAMTHTVSNLLRSELAVVKRHAGDSQLAEAELRGRVGGLYRALINALVEEGKLAEARQEMARFASSDDGELTIQCQRALIDALIEVGQFSAARQQMAEFASSDGGGLAIQCQRALLWLLRGHFMRFRDLSRRARASVTYRICRHFQRGVGLRNQRL